MPSNTENDSIPTSTVKSHELANDCLEAVNCGIDPGTFGEEIQHGHHHLQQLYFKQIVKPSIIALASSPTDKRNKTVVNEAQEIVETMGWGYLE